MTESPRLALRLLVAAVICGGAMGLFYDLQRALRQLFSLAAVPEWLTYPGWCPAPRPCGKIRRRAYFAAQFVSDVIFCVASGLAVSFLLFSENDGAFRGFVPLGMGAGFALWRVSVGRPIGKALEGAAFFARVLVMASVRIAARPIIGAGGRLRRRHQERCRAQREKGKQKAERRTETKEFCQNP